jgi:O-antigen/teichoic acid export membrane protein
MKGAGVRSVIKNSSFLFSSHVLTTLLRIAYIIVLARILGPDAYGMLNYCLSWYLTFISLTYLGLDIVLGREVGRNHSSAPILVGSTFILRAGATLVVSVISALIAYLFEANPEAKILIIVFSLALIGRAIWLWCSSVFSAFEDTRHVFVLELIFRPLEIIIIVLLLLYSPFPAIILIGIAHTALWWLQAIAGLFTILKYVTPIKLRVNWPQARRLLAAGVPGALYILALSWFMQAPIVLYRQLLGTGDDLGHFALAMQVIGYLVVIPVLAGNAALPVLSRSAAREDGKDRMVALAMLLFIPAIGVLVSLFGMWLAAPLTAIIFGAKYVHAGVILSEAIWLLTPFSLAIGLQQLVFARGSRIRISLWGILGAITMAALFSPLTQAFYYRGALLATGLGMLVWAIGLMITLRRIFYKL